MSFFKSLIDVVSDAATIVTAPVEVALDLTAVVTKPLADGARVMTQTVKDVTERE